MGKLKRIFQHVAMTSRKARRAFPQASLTALHAAITEGEQQHRAELKLIIEPELPLPMLLANETARARAHVLFSLYRVWDTQENCGVLVYINLADRQVEIITDRAVGHAVKQQEWATACKLMTQGFAQGRFHESTLEGIAYINTLLTQHFPNMSGSDQHNELSNRPVLL